MIGWNPYLGGDHMIQTEAQCQSDSDTGANAHSRGTYRNPENMHVRRTQSRADAELVSPLRCRIGEDAVQSNPGKKESSDF
jgi:hypothetical protein